MSVIRFATISLRSARLPCLATFWLGILTFAIQNPAQAASPRDLSFVARHDSTPQHYVLVEPSDKKLAEPATALIVLHGHGADRWQFIKQDRDECRAVRDFATTHGLLLASPDYRASTSWMGPAAEADLLQLIEILKRDHGIRRVLLCGGSMGATSSLTFAALHPELIAGVTAFNGHANHLEYENFQDAIQASFGGTKREIPLEYKNRSAEYWPERLTMPIAIALGGRDTVVPPDSCRRLARVLEKLGVPLLLLDRPETEHSSNYADVTQCLEFMLRHCH